jgi:hypothetical protein
MSSERNEQRRHRACFHDCTASIGMEQPSTGIMTNERGPSGKSCTWHHHPLIFDFQPLLTGASHRSTNDCFSLFAFPASIIVPLDPAPGTAHISVLRTKSTEHSGIQNEQTTIALEQGMAARWRLVLYHFMDVFCLLHTFRTIKRRGFILGFFFGISIWGSYLAQVLFPVAPLYMMVHACNRKLYCSMRFQVKDNEDCQWKFSYGDGSAYADEVYSQEYSDAAAEARYQKVGIYNLWQPDP